MCGIIGVVNFSKSNIRELQNFMAQGAITGVLRGEDSTGLFQVNRNNKPEIYKMPYSGEIFSNTKGFKKHLYKMDEPGFTILHHRAATRGTVSQSNAHPFGHEDGKRFIIGVHNGTLNGACMSYKGNTFDVDSDYMFYRMLSDGSKKGLESVSGAIAAVWMEEDGNLRLFSNGERALHFGFVRDKNAMLIASEAGMLYWLASRNALELDSILAPEKNTIHLFDREKNVREFTTQALEVPAASNFRQGRYSDWGQRQYIQDNTQTGGTGGTSTNNNVRLKEYLDELGISRDAEVNFWVDNAVYTDQSTKITGWAEIPGKDFVPAVMYGVTPTIIRSIGEAAHVVVRVRSSTKLQDSASLEYVDGLIVTQPTGVITKSKEDEVFEIDEPDGEEVVPGPNEKPIGLRQFFRMTTDGCMQCGCSLTPKDAREGNLVWVNEDKNAICKGCADEQIARSGAA